MTKNGGWRRMPLDAKVRALVGDDIACYQRDLPLGGHLSVLVGVEPDGWHLSISHRANGNPPKPGRYPTWDEIKDARYRFCPDDVTMAMFLPPSSEFVNVHPTTFHLYETPSRSE